jgi:hypothetical protein
MHVLHDRPSIAESVPGWVLTLSRENAATSRTVLLHRLEQSAATIRTELTRRCCEAPFVIDPVEPEAFAAALELSDVADPLFIDELEPASSIPVTSTRLPTFFCRSALLPSSM